MPSGPLPDPHPICALSCDVGFTLLETCRSPLDLYIVAAQKVGVALDATRLGERMALAHRQRVTGAFHASDDGRCSEEHERGMWRGHSAFVARAFPVLEERLDDWYHELMEVFDDPRSWRPIPGAIAALANFVERGGQLGLVTNWHRAVAPILSHHGLDQLPQFTLISAVVGYRKPHPEIFAEAQRRFDVAPERVLHIGDSPEEDVAGALRSGMRAALFHRGTAREANGDVPVLADWNALQEILGTGPSPGV